MILHSFVQHHLVDIDLFPILMYSFLTLFSIPRYKLKLLCLTSTSSTCIHLIFNIMKELPQSEQQAVYLAKQLYPFLSVYSLFYYHSTRIHHYIARLYQSICLSISTIHPCSLIYSMLCIPTSVFLTEH